MSKIAEIGNLSKIAITAQSLLQRQDGLPGLGVYYGPSGWGKTTTATDIANRTRAYYISMKSAWTKKVLLEKICLEIGVQPGKTLADSLDVVAENLAASGRLLMIDEADFAVNKSGSMIELIRDIYDSSQAPILLIGEEQLPIKLKRYERFHGRVLVWLAALPAVEEDARLLADIYAPGEALSSYQDALIETLFEKLKPAHTTCIFSYGAA